MSTTLDQVRKALGHMTMDWQPKFWLDTKIPDLNRVVGHRARGLPYGRFMEMSGWESHGKTAIAMALAALAQRNGALVIWVDLENSFEEDWAKQRGFLRCPACDGTGRTASKKAGKGEVLTRCKVCGLTRIDCPLCAGAGCAECHNSGEEAGSGLDNDRLIVIRPYVGQFQEVEGKKKKLSNSRLSTSVELLVEAEKCMGLAHKKFDRLVVVVDSLASILTEGEAAAGLDGANMRTNADLPMFLSRLFRRWTGLAQVYNALVIFTNQLRTKPGVKYGSPFYTPGGNAPLFYSHVRVRVKRTGKIVDGGCQIGIQGVLQAHKNKVGGEQWAEVGYKLVFNGAVQFCDPKDVGRKAAEDE